MKGEEGVKLQAKLKSLQTELQDMMDKDESNQRKLANQETEIANLQYERVSTVNAAGILWNPILERWSL